MKIIGLYRHIPYCLLPPPNKMSFCPLYSVVINICILFAQGPISDMVDFVLFIIFFIMLLVQLTLHMFADPSALYPHQGVEKAGEKEPLLPHKSSLPPQCPKRQTTAVSIRAAAAAIHLCIYICVS